MDLSPDTESVINALNDALEGGLRKRNDVASILEMGASFDEHELFNKITQTGTALWKVYKTLRRQKVGADGYQLLEKEFGNQLNALREQLASMVDHADDDTVRRFDEIYFGMSQGVIRNLTDLAHDLAHIKDLQRGA